MARPNIPQLSTFYQAGIDPKTRLPMKLVGALSCGLKDNIKKNLRIKDEQQAINRYRWGNLPNGLSSQLLERVIYYKGRGAFFYLEAMDQFYFLPFTLSSSKEKVSGIDCYGRFTEITPLPFYGTSDAKGPWIPSLKLTPVYDLKIYELELKDILESCVIISDYSEQISQTIIPRQILNDPILDVEAEMIPFMRTALQNSTGTKAVRVNNEDENANVMALNQQIQNAALNGEKFQAVTAAVEFQELGDASCLHAPDFMQGYESIDNFRLGLMGINNAGAFEKKAHMLETEQAMASGADQLVLQDGLKCRQRACDIINSIWGLGVTCDISEELNGDVNMDGFIDDSQDESGTMEGEQYGASLGGEVDE